MQILAANNATTVLSAGISATATTLSVATGTGSLFPSPVAGTSIFKLTLTDAATGTLTEIMHVTAVSADTFTVIRAQEGTTARIWSANDLVDNMITAGTLAALAQTANNLSDLTSIPAALANLGSGGFCADTSTTANSVVIASPVTLADGVPFLVKFNTANTGATTIKIGSAAAIPLVGVAGALQGGEIAAGGYGWVVYSSTLASAVMLSPVYGAALQIAPATKSEHAVQLGQATGRLLNVQIFTSSGTYTPYSSLVNTIEIEMVGGGGAGGGAGYEFTAGYCTIGGPGSSGGYCRHRMSVPASAVVVVGSAGTCTAGDFAGGAGMASSFTVAGATVVLAAGGYGGSTSGNVNTAALAYFTTAPSPTGNTGGNIISCAQEFGVAAQILSTSTSAFQALSGTGGNGKLGMGGVGRITRIAAAVATGYGAGGGGAIQWANATNTNTYAGGNGSPGVVIIREYA